MPRKRRVYIRKREPNGSLLTMCRPIQDVKAAQPFVVELVRQLLHNKLEGLSANQLGVSSQVFVTNVIGDGIRIFCNPILYIDDYDQEEIVEECASRRITKERLRHQHVMVDALNFKGDRFVLRTLDYSHKPDVAFRLSARIQHEMEHMYGLCTRTEPSPEQTALADLLEQPLDEHKLPPPGTGVSTFLRCA